MWLLYLRTRLKPCSFLYPDFKLAFMINFHFYQNMVKIYLQLKYVLFLPFFDLRLSCVISCKSCKKFQIFFLLKFTSGAVIFIIIILFGLLYFIILYAQAHFIYNCLAASQLPAIFFYVLLLSKAEVQALMQLLRIQINHTPWLLQMMCCWILQ